MKDRGGISFNKPDPPAGPFIAAGGPERIEYIGSRHGLFETLDMLDDDVDQLANGHIALDGEILGFKSGVNDGVHHAMVIDRRAAVNLQICSRHAARLNHPSNTATVSGCGNAMTVAVCFLNLKDRFLHALEQYMAVEIFATKPLPQHAHSFSMRAD